MRHEEDSVTLFDLARTLPSSKPISIRQLYYLPVHDGEARGEYRSDHETKHCSSDADVGRLIAQAEELMNIAAEKQSLDDSPYTVTRIATSEFSFYSKRPLDESQLFAIMKQLRRRATKHPNNVHLALGTVAVKIRDVIYNIALYINCGEKADIQLHHKLSASTIDPEYSTARLFSLPVTQHKSTLTLSNGDTYKNAPAIVPVADSQLQIFTTICLDHSLNRGLHFATQTLKKDDIAMSSSTDYLITSGSIPSSWGPIPTTGWSHADFIQTRSLADFDEGLASHLISPAHFGGRGVVYDFGIQPVGELNPTLEVQRRQANRRRLSRDIERLVTMEMLEEAIEIALETAHIEHALKLLEYTPYLSTDILLDLADKALDRLPCLELFRALEAGFKFNADNTQILIGRSYLLCNEHKAQLMDWLIINDTDSDTLNRYITLLHSISSEQITQLLTTEELHNKLSRQSLNRLTYMMEDREDLDDHTAALDSLADRFDDLSPRAQLILQKHRGLLSFEKRALVADDVETPRPF